MSKMPASQKVYEPAEAADAGTRRLDLRASGGLECMEIFGGSDSRLQSISVPGVDASVSSRPHAGSVAGGDIYYVSLCGSGNVSRFALADVSGHGDEVAEVSKNLRRLMRKHINMPSQSRFAKALNREFTELSDAGRFATAVLMTYYAPTDQLIVSNAGHPCPLWYRASERSWQRLCEQHPLASSRGDVRLGIHNLPLGVIGETRYTQFAVPLDPDDLVIAYTDGLSEARDGSGAMLGEEGLLSIVRDLDDRDPDGLLAELDAAVQGATASLDDDATVMLLRHNGSSPPRQTAGRLARTMGRLLRVLSDDPAARMS